MSTLNLLNTAAIHVPTVYLEVLATGFIIGAGTKPLHDLTQLITAAKTSATDSKSHLERSRGSAHALDP